MYRAGFRRIKHSSTLPAPGSYLHQQETKEERKQYTSMLAISDKLNRVQSTLTENQAAVFTGVSKSNWFCITTVHDWVKTRANFSSNQK